MTSFIEPPPARARRPRKPRGAGGPNPAAANAAAASFAALTSRLDYLSAPDVEKVRLGYKFADEAHLGQIRASGEPYITHPIAVAAQCAEWKLHAQALMAAAVVVPVEETAAPVIAVILPLLVRSASTSLSPGRVRSSLTVRR